MVTRKLGSARVDNADNASAGQMSADPRPRVHESAAVERGSFRSSPPRASEPARAAAPGAPERIHLVIELPPGLELELVDDVTLVELVELHDGGVSTASVRFAA